MQKVKCQGCGELKEIPEKPAPKNNREAKQILFNCPACGAVNYRDGTARANKNLQAKINKVKTGKKPVKTQGGIDEKVEPKKETGTGVIIRKTGKDSFWPWN